MRSPFLLTAIILLHQTICAQQQSIYQRQWNEIDSLIVLKSLPKTALQKVNTVYADAKSKGIHDEVIKALLYRLSLESQTTNPDINKRVGLIEQELQTIRDPAAQAVLQVFLARILYVYYENSFLLLRDRSETIRSEEN